MPHIYCGDPNEDFSLALCEELVNAGADMLELGIPFSDPIADGPTLTLACERALQGGTTPRSCLALISGIKERVGVPVIVNSYYNILYTMGLREAVRKVKECGADGLLVPDAPLEEAGELLRLSREEGIDLILQVAPTTSDERLGRIVSHASGFLYVINFEGVTGVRDEPLKGTIELLRRVRTRTSLPLMAGFGISKPEQARLLVEKGADGVVVGSAIAEIYSQHLDRPERALPRISLFVRQMKQACVEGYRRRRHS